MDPQLAEALARIKYEGETPWSLAELCKDNGNKNYGTALKRKRKMYFKEALKHYTEGCLHAMKVRQSLDSQARGLGPIDGDVVDETKSLEERYALLDELQAALLANRAACNLSLRNYGSVKRDCGDALKIKPTFTKAQYRYAKVRMESEIFLIVHSWKTPRVLFRS
jgi:hypothetical protein